MQVLYLLLLSEKYLYLQYVFPKEMKLWLYSFCTILKDKYQLSKATETGLIYVRFRNLLFQITCVTKMIKGVIVKQHKNEFELYIFASDHTFIALLGK